MTTKTPEAVVGEAWQKFTLEKYGTQTGDELANEVAAVAVQALRDNGMLVASQPRVTEPFDELRSATLTLVLEAEAALRFIDKHYVEHEMEFEDISTNPDGLAAAIRRAREACSADIRAKLPHIEKD